MRKDHIMCCVETVRNIIWPRGIVIECGRNRSVYEETG